MGRCKSLFVCLSHSRIFNWYGDVTTTDERLQIFTFTRHSWPLSSEVTLACHTYCDTEHPFIMVISEDPWHSQLLLSIYSGTGTKCIYGLVLSRLDSNTQSSAWEAFALTDCATAVVVLDVNEAKYPWRSLFSNISLQNDKKQKWLYENQNFMNPGHGFLC